MTKKKRELDEKQLEEAAGGKKLPLDRPEERRGLWRSGGGDRFPTASADQLPGDVPPKDLEDAAGGVRMGVSKTRDASAADARGKGTCGGGVKPPRLDLENPKDIEDAP